MLKLLNMKLLLANLATLAVLASAAIYQRHEVAKAEAAAERQKQYDEAFRRRVEEYKRKHSSAVGNEGETWNTYIP